MAPSLNCLVDVLKANLKKKSVSLKIVNIKKDFRHRLMSVVEPLHEADEDDDAVFGGDSGNLHDTFNVSVR